MGINIALNKMEKTFYLSCNDSKLIIIKNNYGNLHFINTTF